MRLLRSFCTNLGGTGHACTVASITSAAALCTSDLPITPLQCCSMLLSFSRGMERGAKLAGASRSQSAVTEPQVSLHGSGGCFAFLQTVGVLFIVCVMA